MEDPTEREKMILFWVFMAGLIIGLLIGTFIGSVLITQLADPADAFYPGGVEWVGRSDNKRLDLDK